MNNYIYIYPSGKYDVLMKYYDTNVNKHLQLVVSRITIDITSPSLTLVCWLEWLLL